MAELDFDNITPIPSEVLFKGLLRLFLQKLESAEPPVPHTNFSTAINTILVWAGARKASLPANDYNEYCLKYLINLLNKVSPRIQSSGKVTILSRQQVHPNGIVTNLPIITFRDTNRVHHNADSLICDQEVGLELNMYPPNVDCFSKFGFKQPPGSSTFSIWEVGSEALVYTEVWWEVYLSPAQLEEFLLFCERKVDEWNRRMATSGFPFRFYGTMDWKLSDFKSHQAKETKRYFGREYIGVGRRGEEINVPSSQIWKEPLETFYLLISLLLFEIRNSTNVRLSGVGKAPTKSPTPAANPFWDNWMAQVFDPVFVVKNILFNFTPIAAPQHASRFALSLDFYKICIMVSKCGFTIFILMWSCDHTRTLSPFFDRR
jgi:hypothetical protein